MTAAPDRPRCDWATTAPDYLAYHDEEWGTPRYGDDALFERLCLEAFQSGLSFLVILRKRAAFRAAFANFSIDAVAGFDAADEERLLADTGIVRNGAKIRAAIGNARAAQQVDGGLSNFLWSFAPPPTSRARRPRAHADVPSMSAASTAMAKELKRRGFRFVGPTTTYALMQATGMVDDHIATCWRANHRETPLPSSRPSCQGSPVADGSAVASDGKRRPGRR